MTCRRWCRSIIWIQIHILYSSPKWHFTQINMKVIEGHNSWWSESFKKLTGRRRETFLVDCGKVITEQPTHFEQPVTKDVFTRVWVYLSEGLHFICLGPSVKVLLICSLHVFFRYLYPRLALERKHLLSPAGLAQRVWLVWMSLSCLQR